MFTTHRRHRHLQLLQRPQRGGGHPGGLRLLHGEQHTHYIRVLENSLWILLTFREISLTVLAICYRWPRPLRRRDPSAGRRVGRVWATSCAGWVAASTAAPATWSWPSPSATPASNLHPLPFLCCEAKLYISYYIRNKSEIFNLCLRILGIPNISRHTIQTCCMLHLWRHLSERNDSHHLIILISNRFCTGLVMQRIGTTTGS